LWILNTLTPQEIKEKILDGDSIFCKQLINYLESVHVGEFITGSQVEVTEKVKVDMLDEDKYKNPIENLPTPPASCDCSSNDNIHQINCAYSEWLNRYKFEIDDIILKSNIHRCMDNPYGKCRARFPRPIFKETQIDLETGTIFMKKLEQWINTYTPVFSYLFRCNTDVTSLKSGTAIKGVVQYVTNYITKSALKTHVMFEVIRSVFDK
ncbi:hypothetical protein BDN72DRAFT_732555, partial [Pluteus cervinus]